ncbi:hypothetical protein ACVIU4_000927 [Bradyrhizobium barranii subsp. barranii]|nr:hypothetical protein [Bradyrhizobium japonicum]MCP1963825.1 hypothetical protein [Bradyrhizobium japonicum]
MLIGRVSAGRRSCQGPSVLYGGVLAAVTRRLPDPTSATDNGCVYKIGLDGSVKLEGPRACSHGGSLGLTFEVACVGQA